MIDAPLRVAPVAGRGELDRFISLPWRLYSGDPFWIPPLKSQVRALLDPRHAFYQGGAAERELFLAWRGSRVAGRIVAILNRAHNSFHQDRWGFFGFFECEDDPAAAAALVEAAAQWVRGQGCDTLVGPVNPSTNYECGLLVRGFDAFPRVMMPYNPPRYAELLEGCGLAKVKDVLAFESPVHPGSWARLERVAEKTRRREPTLVVRRVDLKRFRKEVAILREIYNAAWERNWGFVPASEAEFTHLAKELKPLVDPHLLQIAFLGEEPVAFLLALPDVNPALAVLNGSMANPLRVARAMWVGRRRDALRLITMGVKETYRRRGIEAVLFFAGLRAALERGYRRCEYSWILEDNELALRTVRLMDATLTKIYRLYARPVSPHPAPFAEQQTSR